MPERGARRTGVAASAMTRGCHDPARSACVVLDRMTPRSDGALAGPGPTPRRAFAGARWTRLAALCAAMLVGACAAIEETGRSSIDDIANGMPREIAGFMLGETSRRPGPVLSFDYATANRAAVATVLVYATGGRPVSSDPDSPEIDREVTSAVAEVTDAPYGRTGRRLVERRRTTIADPGLRCAHLEGSFGRAPVARTLCVGGAQGRFVKIQVTMAARPNPPADATAFAAGALRAVRGR